MSLFDGIEASSLKKLFELKIVRSMRFSIWAESRYISSSNNGFLDSSESCSAIIVGLESHAEPPAVQALDLGCWPLVASSSALLHVNLPLDKERILMMLIGGVWAVVSRDWSRNGEGYVGVTGDEVVACRDERNSVDTEPVCNGIASGTKFH